MERKPTRTGALLREPLVHFAALGAVLFGLHALVAPPERGSRERIVVAREFAVALEAEAREHTGRALDRAEANDLVERYVDEEVLYREALALGLDRGDVIVRRRLVQKMELTAQARVREPTAEEIAAYVAEHPERYRPADVVSLDHVFVSRDRHGAESEALAKDLLSKLLAGEPPGSLGDPFVAGASFGRRTRADLEGLFGAPFAEGAFSAPEGRWVGPLSSTHGIHLVRVNKRDARSSEQGPAATARAREDMTRERREQAVRAEIARLRERYSIEIEGRP